MSTHNGNGGDLGHAFYDTLEYQEADMRRQEYTGYFTKEGYVEPTYLTTKDMRDYGIYKDCSAQQLRIAMLLLRDLIDEDEDMCGKYEDLHGEYKLVTNELKRLQ